MLLVSDVLQSGSVMHTSSCSSSNSALLIIKGLYQEIVSDGLMNGRMPAGNYVEFWLRKGIQKYSGYFTCEFFWTIRGNTLVALNTAKAEQKALSILLKPSEMLGCSQLLS